MALQQLPQSHQIPYDPSQSWSDQQTNALHQQKIDLVRKNLALIRKIAELTGALEECLEYFEDRMDVSDDGEGGSKPNYEMTMSDICLDALGRSRNPFA